MNSNENDIKNKIERDSFKFEIANNNNKIENLEKRYADRKWHILTYFTIIPILVAALAIVFGLNLNNEKNQIRDFQKDIRDEIIREKDKIHIFLKENRDEIKRELGKSDDTAILKVLTKEKIPLQNNTIEARIDKNKDGNAIFIIDYIIWNDGSAPTGYIWTKMYSGKGMDIGSASTDEDNYSSQIIMPPEKSTFNNIPAHLSFEASLTITLNSSNKIIEGIYPVLVKWYYGKNKVEKVPFFIKITRDIG